MKSIRRKKTAAIRSRRSRTTMRNKNKKIKNSSHALNVNVDEILRHLHSGSSIVFLMFHVCVFNDEEDDKGENYLFNFIFISIS